MVSSGIFGWRVRVGRSGGGVGGQEMGSRACLAWIHEVSQIVDL